MRARVRIKDLSRAQWDRVQTRVQAVYAMPEGAARLCVEFESGHPQGEVRHVEMPVYEFATVLAELNALDQLTAAGLPRRPVLPSAAQVRDLSAAEAVRLTAEMNGLPVPGRITEQQALDLIVDSGQEHPVQVDPQDLA